METSAVVGAYGGDLCYCGTLWSRPLLLWQLMVETSAVAGYGAQLGVQQCIKP